MKRFIKSLVVVAFVFGFTVPAWSQASTEGTEFWVALNMTTGTGGNDHAPFICITTQHPGGSYTITNPADPSFTPITGQIPLNGYIKINASTSPASGEIDLRKWYPVGQTADKISNQIKDVGLKVTTTVDCSVYAGNRLPQSFDAANILPVTALQKDYITQDYPGYDHENKGGGYPVTTILATENSTQVTIKPKSAVLNNNGTATITKTLDAGQVLYLTGENRASLSGTVVSSNKKIAVFTGVNNTDVPGPVSARDHLYEQNMPVDYWGTHFVVTRSMKKDANRIRVTASNDGTVLKVDGRSIATINTGETYEFELCSALMRTQEGYTKAETEGRGCDLFFEGEAHYLETSCPCAVFSYDVSENYYIKKNGTSERDENSAGDPAMVWISPLEQQLRKVTFGVMNTDKTPTHYVNIITPTNGASSLEVKKIDIKDNQVVYGDNLVQPADIKTVPGNADYSYARVKLEENQESVYTITSDKGFIAHVYGSGNKESYAYSAGSAAVKEGVMVGDIIYNNGEKDPNKYICVNNKDIEFNASVGLDEITRADWNFGDGTTLRNAQTSVIHTYTNPGWYDVTVQRFGHQVCTDVDEQDLGAISFSIRVIKPYIKYVPTAVCHEKGETLPADGPDGSVDLDQCLDTIIVPYNVHGYNTDSIIDLGAVADSIVVDGVTYRRSGEAMQVLKNSDDCELRITTKWEIIASLDFKITNTDVTACDSTDVELPFDYVKGDLGEAWIVDLGTGKKTDVDRSYLSDLEPGTGTFNLPTKDLRPGIYNLELHIKDPQAEQYGWKIKEYTYQIRLTVKYSEHIFKRKYNNVLAVYKAGRGANAGYSFNGYQWYFRDAEDNIAPIFGATSSVYHTEEPLKTGWYSVDLTDQAAVTIRTCEQYIDESKLPDFTPAENEPEGAPQKVLRDQRVLILMENKLYNMYGQQVK